MKMNTTCKVIGIVLLGMIFVFSGVALAKSPKAKGPAEKATGEVGYDAYGLFRWIEFNAHEQSTTCQAAWNLVGDYVVSVYYNGSLYAHDMVITEQDEDGNLTGTGGWRAGGPPYSITWSLTNNSYAANGIIHLEFDYDGSSYIAFLDGAIAPDGTISGLWTSNSSNQSDPDPDQSWNTTDMAYADVTGCEGKGTLRYWDANGNWYDVDVEYVNVDDDTAWFAGPVVSASNNSWTSNWLFAKVHDGGEPAAGVDKVWGSFTSMLNAVNGVGFMWDPSAGPFSVQEGNLQVHTY